MYGVGVVTAAQLLVAVGDNPDRDILQLKAVARMC